MKILSDKKYDMLIIEIETLKEIRENDDMCIDMMADRINRLEEENKTLKGENEALKGAMKELNNYNKFRTQENERLKKKNKELQEYKSMYEWLC